MYRSLTACATASGRGEIEFSNFPLEQGILPAILVVYSRIFQVTYYDRGSSFVGCRTIEEPGTPITCPEPIADDCHDMPTLSKMPVDLAPHLFALKNASDRSSPATLLGVPIQ